MARYFVVLKVDDENEPYVVGEVVRDRGDDGRYRDTSLAANIAGERARIVTESELLKMAGGAHAYQRWREGDDTAFRLDSIEQDFLTWAEMFPQFESRRRKAGAGRIVQPTGRVIEESIELQKANREARDRLSAALQRAREEISNTRRLLDDINRDPPDAARRNTRRHLRSVS